MVTYWLLGKQSDSRLKIDLDSDGTMDALGELPGEITEFYEQENVRNVLQFPIPGRKPKSKGKCPSAVEMKKIEENPPNMSDYHGHVPYTNTAQRKQVDVPEVPPQEEQTQGTSQQSQIPGSPLMESPAEMPVDTKSLQKNVLLKQESVDEESHPVKESDLNPSPMPQETTRTADAMEDCENKK